MLSKKAEAARVRSFVGFCDIAESVRLYEQEGEQLSAAWERAIDRHFPEGHARRLLKLEGDAAIFATRDAMDAVSVALSLAAALGAVAPSEHAPSIRLRSGIVEGPYWEGRRAAYGPAINLAARLADQALPGEVLLTEAVRIGLGAHYDDRLIDKGEQFLRNVPQAVRVHAIAPEGPSRALPLMIPDSALMPLVAVIAPTPLGDGAVFGSFAEAFADAIATEIANVRGFGVISRLSARRIATDGAADLVAARRLLGAHYILSGRCLFDGDRVTAWLELADTSDNRVIWTERMAGSFAAMLDGTGLGLEIAERVVRAILRGEHDRARTKPLQTVEHHTLLVSGVSLMHSLSQREFSRAFELLDALAKRASRIASPLAWLARWHNLRVLQGWSEAPRDDARKARDLCSRALDADPYNALAHVMMGMTQTHLERRLDLAAKSYDAAIEANHSEPLAWLLRGALRSFVDDGKGAIADVTHANALSPIDPQRYYYLTLTAGAHLTAGDDATALALARESLRLNRHHLSTLRVKATAHWRLGQEDEARATVAELLRLDPNFTLTRYRAASPSSDYRIGRDVAKSLRSAGVPD